MEKELTLMQALNSDDHALVRARSDVDLTSRECASGAGDKESCGEEAIGSTEFRERIEEEMRLLASQLEAQTKVLQVQVLPVFLLTTNRSYNAKNKL